MGAQIWPPRQLAPSGQPWAQSELQNKVFPQAMQIPLWQVAASVTVADSPLHSEVMEHDLGQLECFCCQIHPLLIL